MPPPDRTEVNIDFRGLVVNADPRDLPDGAATDQRNACCLTPGQLDVRGGIAEVTFEDL